MTGVDRGAVIEQQQSPVLSVNDRFHQEWTLARNRGMTGSRDKDETALAVLALGVVTAHQFDGGFGG